MELNQHPKLRRLPKNLDELATETGAIKRRRNLRGGDDLLWLALTYAGLPESFRTLSALAQRIGCNLNDTSARCRLKNSVEFLSEVLNVVLFGSCRDTQQRGIGRRICLQDATTVSAPGSKGTDWRVHTVFVLGQGMSYVEVTDYSIGESLCHGEYRKEDIVIADQGLATRRSLEHVHSVGANCLVRVCLRNLPMCDETGKPLDANLLLDRADQGIVTHRVLIPLKNKTMLAGRLLIYPVAPEQAARNRRKFAQKASRNQVRAGEMGLRMAGYIALFTTIPDADLCEAEVGKLYRLRWQIELFFKRCKSISGLDKLAAKTPEVAKAYLLGKLILVALTEIASIQVQDELNNGCLAPNLSSWRLHTICREDLIDALREVGDRRDNDQVEALKALADSPRKRKSAASLIEMFNRKYNPDMPVR